jgi:hypothetical protein
MRGSLFAEHRNTETIFAIAKVLARPYLSLSNGTELSLLWPAGVGLMPHRSFAAITALSAFPLSPSFVDRLREEAARSRESNRGR